MSKKRVGLAVCGSFCTFSKILNALGELTEQYNLTPILSEAAATMDTRFGKAADFKDKLEILCGRSAITSIPAAEPIGPKKLLDALVVAPCTGNTLAKLATGITDTSVTMACKAHMRNNRPLIIGVSTNDGLAGNAKNLSIMMNRKNVYFIPFMQDDPDGKPASLVADFSLISETIESALQGVQPQPVLIRS